MKKKIAIYGAGGLGREMAWMLQDIQNQGGEWEVLGFFDDGKPKGTRIGEWPILGGLTEINETSSPLSLVIAISDPKIKETLVNKISNVDVEFPVIIHPSCLAGDRQRNSLGKGVILTAGVILTTHIQLADFVLINLATTVGHDVRIGEFSSIMPGCSISGSVSLGARCFVGTGVRILQNIDIGPDCIIGAGAVVTRNAANGSKLVGIPAAKV